MIPIPAVSMLKGPYRRDTEPQIARESIASPCECICRGGQSYFSHFQSYAQPLHKKKNTRPATYEQVNLLLLYYKLVFFMKLHPEKCLKLIYDAYYCVELWELTAGSPYCI